eukprot:jgi/Picre1/31193/NNA_006547.t1
MPQRQNGPLSLEDLMKKKDLEKKEQSRPVFLTKKERQELALQKRKEEVEEQRRMMEAMRRAREEEYANEDNGYHRSHGEYSRGSRREREEEVRRERERERELQLIKQQYLGGEPKKRKVLKASERTKFHFDWDKSEDTSRDLNPLYDRPHEATLLFGRGMRAGMDRREQKKVAAEIVTKRLKSQGHYMEMFRLERMSRGHWRGLRGQTGMMAVT